MTITKYQLDSKVFNTCRKADKYNVVVDYDLLYLLTTSKLFCIYSRYLLTSV